MPLLYLLRYISNAFFEISPALYTWTINTTRYFHHCRLTLTSPSYQLFLPLSNEQQQTTKSGSNWPSTCGTCDLAYISCAPVVVPLFLRRRARGLGTGKRNIRFQARHSRTDPLGRSNGTPGKGKEIRQVGEVRWVEQAIVKCRWGFA